VGAGGCSGRQSVDEMAHQRRGCTLSKAVLPCFLVHSPLSGELRAGEETEPSGVTREGEKKRAQANFVFKQGSTVTTAGKALTFSAVALSSELVYLCAELCNQTR